MAINTTISTIARSNTPGLKSDVLLIIVALLYHPEKKLIIMGITNNSAMGIPIRNCLKVLFCFSRLDSQYFINASSSSVSTESGFMGYWHEKYGTKIEVSGGIWLVFNILF
jgi:hypothetical protein